MNTFIFIFLIPVMTGIALASFGVFVTEDPFRFFLVIIPVSFISSAIYGLLK